jgi:hypothetical protein
MASLDPREILDQLGAVWSPDFDAYASGELPADRVRCALCQHVPCDCPPFGSPEYFALIDQRHGRRGTRAAEPAATCRAHCDSHFCHLPAGHPGRRETPARERLSTGGRHFGDLYPAGWHRGDSLAADRARHDDRVRQLSRMSKARLRDLALEQRRGMGFETVYGGPAVMSKDELISDIIVREFPGEDRCDSERCRWPDGPHSVYCVPGTAS